MHCARYYTIIIASGTSQNINNGVKFMYIERILHFLAIYSISFFKMQFNLKNIEKKIIFIEKLSILNN